MPNLDTANNRASLFGTDRARSPAKNTLEPEYIPAGRAGRLAKPFG
jgi:hypothetical protein